MHLPRTENTVIFINATMIDLMVLLLDTARKGNTIRLFLIQAGMENAVLLSVGGMKNIIIILVVIGVDDTSLLFDLAGIENIKLLLDAAEASFLLQNISLFYINIGRVLAIHFDATRLKNPLILLLLFDADSALKSTRVLVIQESKWGPSSKT